MILKVNNMKHLDRVEIIVEKEEYASDGVHKGMRGWICDDEKINGYWLINFPQCGEKPDIATIPIKEVDLKLVSIMDASVNERIRAEHGE